MVNEDSFQELLRRFGEKNPSFVRVVMENHFTKGEYESSQGKVVRWKYQANAKEGQLL